MTKRVVVTGMGALTPLGNSVGEYWDGLVNGRSGITRVTRFDPDDYASQIGGEVKGFDPKDYMDRKEAKRMDRFAQFGVAAAVQGLEDAGLKVSDLTPERVGVYLGSGIGGMETLIEHHNVLNQRGPARISPFFVPMMIGNMAAGQIALAVGAQGPNATIVTACASASHAIGEAMRVIQRGEADLVLTGGTEAAIVPLAYAGFCAMRALSCRNDEPERASRPFDRDRDGFVMAEGAGILVLESLDSALNRGARIYAEMVGYGSTCDAYHIAAPAPGGEGGARSMALAMKDAGLTPWDIDYINTHGTSTPAGDVGETQAIKAVFGDAVKGVSVSSTKSMTGHLLGAAGAVEMIAAIKAVTDDIVPPTINLENQDPECDLDYTPNEARKRQVRAVLSNSFGFGGQNATLVVKEYEG